MEELLFMFPVKEVKLWGNTGQGWVEDSPGPLRRISLDLSRYIPNPLTLKVYKKYLKVVDLLQEENCTLSANSLLESLNICYSKTEKLYQENIDGWFLYPTSWEKFLGMEEEVVE